MNISDLDKYLDLVIEASLKAGEAILGVYYSDDFEVEEKGDNSPLTKADLASHNKIVQFLDQTPFPILSEEGDLLSSDQRSKIETLWIVDPLDGTKEFIKRNDEFTINIALINDHLPVLGVVYAPVTKELFYAAEGLGAFKAVLGDIKDTESIEWIKESALKLPLKGDDSVYKVVASRSHLSKETEDYINDLKKEHSNVEITSRGSSLKLCLVAEGQAKCYPRFAPTMEWDIAAGHAICRYSNAQVTDWTTKTEMLYNKENLLNNWFICTN